jgi:hypothetical protein
VKLINWFYNGHLLGAVAALAIGYAVGGRWPVSLVYVFLGLVWYLAQRRWVSGLENIMLFLFIAGAAVAFWAGAPGWMLLVGSILTLGAWDLDHFSQRLSRVDRVDFDTGLGWAHLARLGLVESIALAAGLVPLLVRFEIGFWWIMLLAFLAIIGLSRVVAFVRRME